MQYKFTLVGLLLSALTVISQAPKPEFKMLLEELPRFSSSLETAIATSDFQKKDREMMRFGKDAEECRKQCYRPLQALLKQNIEQRKSAKASAAFSREEQRMMDVYEADVKRFGTATEYTSFLFLMESRPLLHSGKLSWANAKTMSVGETPLFKQLLAIEQSFDWVAFRKEAMNLSTQLQAADPRITALNQKFNQDLESLPKKKIKITDGVYSDIPDPAKAISLYKHYQQQRHTVYESMYARDVQWWQAAYKRLQNIGASLDELAQKIEGGPANNDYKNLWLALADLQGRLLEAMESFAYVTQVMWNDVMLAALNKTSTEESIQIYQGYQQAQN